MLCFLFVALCIGTLSVEPGLPDTLLNTNVFIRNLDSRRSYLAKNSMNNLENIPGATLKGNFKISLEDMGHYIYVDNHQICGGKNQRVGLCKLGNNSSSIWQFVQANTGYLIKSGVYCTDVSFCMEVKPHGNIDGNIIILGKCDGYNHRQRFIIDKRPELHFDGEEGAAKEFLMQIDRDADDF